VATKNAVEHSYMYYMYIHIWYTIFVCTPCSGYKSSKFNVCHFVYNVQKCSKESVRVWVKVCACVNVCAQMCLLCNFLLFI